MNFKKVFALFLTLCMVLSAVPFAAWAEEEADGEFEPETEETETVSEPENTEPEQVLPEEPEELPEPEYPEEELFEEPEEEVKPEKVTPEYLPPNVLANGNEYFTLSEALADLGDGEFEIIFLADLSDSAVIGKDQDITLIMTDCSFSGEIINYGKLTVFGSESGFDGCIITRAYCEKDEDGNVVDEASGETQIEGGNFNGEMILEQKSDARVGRDARPTLLLSSGRFGVELTRRYINWEEEDPEPDYGASAGSIEITGGVFFTDPSEFVAEGYTTYENNGWWTVVPKTEESGFVPGEENSTSGPDTEFFTETESAGENPDFFLPEENQPVKQEESVIPIDVDINITGNGSIAFEGDEFEKGSTLKFAAYSEPVLEIRPAENWKIYNVTVGSNGSATQFGTADTIQLPALESYTTVNVIFAEMKQEEIDSLNAETNDAEGPAEEDPEPFGYAPMLATSREEPTGAKPPLGSSTLRGDPPGGGSAPEEYTIVYEPNGGVFVTGVSATKTYTAGEEVVFPTGDEIKKDDAEKFAGWYDDPDFETFSGTYLPAGSTGDKKFYARWEYKIVVKLDTTKGDGTVIWNSPEGEKPISKEYTISAYSGDSVSLKYNPAVNNIVSSVTLADGTQLTDLDRYMDDSVSRNETITVVFERAVTHSVTFDYNDGKTPNETYNWPVGKEVNFTTPTRSGYVFKGWRCSADDELYPKPNETYTVQETVTFTAEWELEKYTLTYESNGGTALAPVEFTIEDTVPLSIPDLEGATFEGWYLSADFSGDPVPEITGKDYPHNVTVYAKWKYTMYKVTYVYNDGTTPDSSNDVKHGTTLTLPKRTRSGYDFLGWQCSADGETYSANTRYQVKSDVTFTAQWEKQKVYYKVSVYHTNNGAVYYKGKALPSGSSFELEEGETAELKFAATTSGYYVYNCTVNNVRRGSVDGLKVGPIKENVIISVTFAPTFVRPITGDGNHPILWACLMAVSALGLAGIPVLRKKRRAEK